MQRVTTGDAPAEADRGAERSLSRPWQRSAAGLLTGLLIAAAFPPLKLWPLLIVALIPLHFALRGSPGPWAAFRVATLAGATWFALSFYWVHHTLVEMSGLSSGLAVVGVVLFGLFQGLSLGAWAWLVRRFFHQGDVSSLLAAAVSWAAFEMAFPWIFPLPIVLALAPAPVLTQVVDIAGVYGGSALLVCVNLFLAQALARPGVWRGPLAVAAGLLLLLSAYGGLRLWQLSPDPGTRRLRVAWVQPSITPGEKRSRDLDVRFNAVEREWRHLEAVSALAPEIVILPEGSFPFYAQDPRSDPRPEYPSQVRTWTQRLLSHASKIEAPMIFGSLRKLNGRTRNAAFISEAHEGYSIYDKRELIPFGERIPFADTFPWLKGKVKGMGHLDAGTRSPLVEIAGLRLHLSICYEAILPVQVARDAKDVDLLVNLTNDEWFGRTSAPELHLMSQVFRAIETRRPLVRVTNTGISAWVDPGGHVHGRSELFEASHGIWEVPLERSWSPFAFSPRGSVALLLGLGLLPWAWARARRRFFPRSLQGS